jgi:hypothetical protein
MIRQLRRLLFRLTHWSRFDRQWRFDAEHITRIRTWEVPR